MVRRGLPAQRPGDDAVVDRDDDKGRLTGEYPACRLGHLVTRRQVDEAGLPINRGAVEPPGCLEHVPLCRQQDFVDQHQIKDTEFDRRIRLTFGVPQSAATALAVIDLRQHAADPSQVSDRALFPSATMTAMLDLLEHRGWIHRTSNPGRRRSVLIEITPDGGAITDQMLPGICTLERSVLSADRGG
jgi:DNA-binding MarR family transcriptional regulator